MYIKMPDACVDHFPCDRHKRSSKKLTNTVCKVYVENACKGHHICVTNTILTKMARH